MTRNNGWLLILLLVAGAAPAQAETLYVTDRVLVGLHQAADETSALLTSIPSGTAVEALESREGFTRVRTPDGKTGWISSGYLVPQKPATAVVDTLQARQEKLQAELKALRGKLKKTERELQVRRDELDNARTTIRDLKKKAGKAAAPAADPKMAEELAAANQEIENLKQQLAKATAAASEADATQPEPPAAGDPSGLAKRLEVLEAENAALRSRIEIAVANLEGRHVPTAEEMAMVRPGVPGWYWGVAFLLLIIGVVVGISWMDYRHRQRHGGFRI